MENEKAFVIDLNPGRKTVILLMLVLVTASLVGYMAWDRQDASASEAEAPLASSADMRLYYLTTSMIYNGANADTACASGYHMASLWEIMDTSNIKYNPTLGYTRDDSGQGPPNTNFAWVRTGYSNNVGTAAGMANCDNWDSSASGDNGSAARPDSDWSTTPHMIGWEANYFTCDNTFRVWCIED